VLLRIAVGELAAGGALVYRGERLALISEGGAVRALSLVCTHLGCTVNVTPDGLSCPCHGSSFDRTGRVLRGPADRPLREYGVRRVGDFLEVLEA
jgi:Rieske Fe-S protein